MNLGDTVVKNYKVYMHTNRKNNKKYIGVTCMPLNRRWRNGDGYKGNNYFYNSIIKYGWDGFEHKVIKDSLSKEEAEELEIKLIAEYSTTLEDKGYNLRVGGQLGTPTETTKRKTSKSLKGMFAGEKHPMYGLKGEDNPNYGSKRSNETRRKMSISQKGKNIGKNNPNYGVKASKEKLKKMSESMKGKLAGEMNPMYGKYGEDHPASKVVKNINTGKTFISAREASRHYRIQESDISKACNGKRNSAGKHPVTGEKMLWEFVEGDKD